MLRRRHPDKINNKRGNGYANPASVDLTDLVAYSRYDRILSLQAHKVRSPQSGGFLSPFRGRGMEFVEARPYQPGDDIRHLDWRLTARSGKPHSKIFQEERERAVLLWVDLAPTMFFATQGAFKAVIAAHTAALVAWNAIRRGDRVGGIVTANEHHIEIRPKQGKTGVLHFLQQIAKHPAWGDQVSAGKTSVADTFMRLRRVVKPGSLLFLLSDMRGITGDAELQLGQLARHNDIVICHIHDILETRLPPAGVYRISNGSQAKTLYTGNSKFRSQYEQQFALRREYLQALCLKQGLHLISIPTDADLVQTMRRGLEGR